MTPAPDSSMASAHTSHSRETRPGGGTIRDVREDAEQPLVSHAGSGDRCGPRRSGAGVWSFLAASDQGRRNEDQTSTTQWWVPIMPQVAGLATLNWSSAVK